MSIINFMSANTKNQAPHPKQCAHPISAAGTVLHLRPEEQSDGRGSNSSCYSQPHAIIVAAAAGDVLADTL